MLKELTSKSMGKFTDFELLTQEMKEGLRLLEVTYSTSGIIAPRKGQGAFMKMDPLPFVAIEFGTLRCCIRFT